VGWLRDQIERGLGLGTADEPRRVGVEARTKRLDLKIHTTPGARLRLVRDRRDGETQRMLLWCIRRGIPVELVEGAPGIYVGARLVTADEARKLV
jgi:hypothetical protein